MSRDGSPELKAWLQKKCHGARYFVATSDFIVCIGAGMTVKFFNLFFINDYRFTNVQVSTRNRKTRNWAARTAFLRKISMVRRAAATCLQVNALNCIYPLSIALCMRVVQRVSKVVGRAQVPWLAHRFSGKAGADTKIQSVGQSNPKRLLGRTATLIQAKGE